MTPILRNAALGLLCIALAACSTLQRDPPVRQTYLLDVPAAQPVATASPLVMRIGTVTLAAPFRDRTFVVRETDLRYQADFYHEFVVPPAAMFGEAIARHLEGARVFARVLPPGVAPEADLVLDAFVSAFYADNRRGQPAAEMAITFFVSRADRPGAPAWSREYRRRIPIPPGSAEAYVAAQSRALAEILAELARDLSAAPAL